MNCKDCKHWRRGGRFVHEKGIFGLNPDFVGEVVLETKKGPNIVCMVDPKAKTGLCLHPSMGSDYVDSWMERNSGLAPKDGVFASSDDERGDLTAGEDFGCIHFSRIENKS